MKPDILHSDMCTATPPHCFVVNRIPLTLVLAVSLLFLAACTQAAPSPTPTATVPPPTAEEVLEEAHDAMNVVQSYRFRGSITGTSNEGDEGIQESVQTGEWAAPDRFDVRFEGVGEGAGHVNELINVGERVFASDSDSNEGAWMEQWSLPQDMASSRAPSGLLAIPNGVELQALEEDTVNGVPVFHLTYVRKQETSQPTPSGADGLPAPGFYANKFELFIGKEDYRVLQLIREDEFRGTSSLTTADGQERFEEIITITQTSMEFYDYDRPVMIELPELGGG